MPFILKLLHFIRAKSEMFLSQIDECFHLDTFMFFLEECILMLSRVK